MRIPIPGLYYLSAGCLALIWALILARGVREGMIRRYRLFYAYLGVFAGAYFIKLALVHWLSAVAYMHLYFFTGLVQGLLAVALLYQIFQLGRGGGGSAARWVVSLAIPVIVFIQAAVETDAHIYMRIINGLFCFIVVFAAVNITRLNSLILGKNYHSILGGIVFPYLLAAVNHLTYFSDFPWWPVEVFAHLGEPIVLLSWGVMLVGMWRYDPPKAWKVFLDEQRREAVGREVTA